MSRYKVIPSERADTDLERIQFYLMGKTPHKVEKWTQGLLNALDTLEEMPRAYAVAWDSRLTATKFALSFMATIGCCTRFWTRTAMARKTRFVFCIFGTGHKIFLFQQRVNRTSNLSKTEGENKLRERPLPLSYPLFDDCPDSIGSIIGSTPVETFLLDKNGFYPVRSLYRCLFVLMGAVREKDGLGLQCVSKCRPRSNTAETGRLGKTWGGRDRNAGAYHGRL